MLFGNVHYPDVTFYRDKVLIKYPKGYVNPSVSVGNKLRVLPLDWIYE